MSNRSRVTHLLGSLVKKLKTGPVSCKNDSTVKKLSSLGYEFEDLMSLFAMHGYDVDAYDVDGDVIIEL